MAYNPRLRYFIKLDSNGNLTQTTVIRKKMPKIGRWLEVWPNTCCTTTTTTTTEAG